MSDRDAISLAVLVLAAFWALASFDALAGCVRSGRRWRVRLWAASFAASCLAALGCLLELSSSSGRQQSSGSRITSVAAWAFRGSVRCNTAGVRSIRHIYLPGFDDRGPRGVGQVLEISHLPV